MLLEVQWAESAREAFYNLWQCQKHRERANADKTIFCGRKVRNDVAIDQWILRKALSTVLPADLLQPSDTDLWQGAGVGFLLALSAEDQITDEEFYRERVSPAG